jgi:hypothetical protein
VIVLLQLESRCIYDNTKIGLRQAKMHGVTWTFSPCMVRPQRTGAQLHLQQNKNLFCVSSSK